MNQNIVGVKPFNQTTDGEQTVNSNTEGVTTHILTEVAINRVKTHQSNTLAVVAIDQSTGRSRH